MHVTQIKFTFQRKSQYFAGPVAAILNLYQQSDQQVSVAALSLQTLTHETHVFAQCRIVSFLLL